MRLANSINSCTLKDFLPVWANRFDSKFHDE